MRSPKEAEIVSHRLMLRAGMIRQEAAGIYAWLPLGLRVLKKIEQIVREEQDRAGAIEMLMPTHAARPTCGARAGRYDDYGRRCCASRTGTSATLLYGPTNEEMITEIFRGLCRALIATCRKTLYHIQWKFRDEVAPALRRDARARVPDEGRLFLRSRSRPARAMSYNKMFVAYLRTFARHGAQGDPDAGRDRPDRRRPVATSSSSWPRPASPRSTAIATCSTCRSPARTSTMTATSSR